MSFALADGLHAGLDCAGEAAPGIGVVTGWVRHGADALLDVAIEEAPGRPLGVLLLSFHPRPDLPTGAGLAVTGFVLVHASAANGAAGILVLRAGDRTARLDLSAHDVPRDVPAALAGGEGRAAFDLMSAGAASAGRVPLLGTDGGGLGPFARTLARQTRLTGPTDWFRDFRRVAAHRLPLGEVVLAGSFAVAGGTDDAEVVAVALAGAAGVTDDAAAGVAGRLLPLRGATAFGVPEGFALHGFLDGVTEDESVDLVVSVRRGGASWSFRAEAIPGPLEPFLHALTLTGFDLPDPRAAALERWLRHALDARLDALRGALSRLTVLRGAGAMGAGRGTALFFDLDEPLAARVLALVAPTLERRFERIIVAGAAASRAVAALLGRPGLEVAAEAGPAEALAAAATSRGMVVPADTATLASLAIGGDGGDGPPVGLDPARLDELLLLHGLAGTGGMGATLRRVVAMLEGADVAPPAAAGPVVAAHLAAVWRLAAAGARGRA